MADVSSLHDATVEKIIKLAQGRSIPGTRRYARVCRRWQRAGSNIGAAEVLQLFMDLGHMSEAEWERARDWMAMHGKAVVTLVLETSTRAQLEWFQGSAAALAGIRRLEMTGYHSLYLLIPVLGQLPHLQHLAAGISLSGGGRQPWVVGHPHAPRRGCFEHAYLGQQETSWQVPDLQQLCPGLTHLRLTLYRSYSINGAHMVDEQLPRLLPARLQQLSLAAGVYHTGISVHSSSLVHLSALQQLTLENLQVVAGQGPDSVAEDLGALQQLQQLRLSHTEEWVLDPGVVQQLAPKVTSRGVFAWATGVVPTLPHLVNLQQLVLTPDGNTDGVPEGTAEALAALTSLQQLVLGCLPADSLVPVLQQVAAMPSLRSLQLESFDDDPRSLAAALAQCTQLTSLVIKSASAVAIEDGAFVAMLQQLTGLRALAALTVPAEMLEQQRGAWLAPLTALTRLGVRVGRIWTTGPGFWVPQHGIERELLQQVQAFPPGLQQVVVTHVESARSREFKPESWQFTPAVPGGVQCSVWVEEESGTASGWARPFHPCPHLPGVWELQGEVQGHSE
jgi:hypothetical protein